MLGGANVQIHEKKYDVIVGIQRALVDSSYDTIKLLTDMDNVVFRQMLHTNEYYEHLRNKGGLSGCDKITKYFLDNEV